MFFECKCWIPKPSLHSVSSNYPHIATRDGSDREWWEELLSTERDQQVDNPIHISEIIRQLKAWEAGQANILFADKKINTFLATDSLQGK